MIVARDVRQARIAARARAVAFLRDRRGAVAIVFVIALPMLLGAVSAGIEYGRLLHRRAQLQTAADAAALAGGNMLKLVNTDDAAVRSAALQVFATQAQTPPDRRSTATAHVTDRMPPCAVRPFRCSPPRRRHRPTAGRPRPPT
ncbi:TadE/TadG family type IV pilus assembly protein [Methylobacterium oryzisoli]|uniref:TadE/TadG family type IV pilus assembly protein n=1 Tax=Methylobacterium oryzisoli TaxID=3385502 RepID=UPI003D80A7E9